jgi:hypothetical protein
VRKSIFLFGSFCLMTASFGTSLSAASERSGFRLAAVVNTVCRLELPGAGTAQSNDVIDFGSFYQLCNARNGYRVTMRHPANMEGAILFWDGRAVPLSPGEETVIADENRAAMKYSDVRLDVRGVDASASSFSFRIDPKGLVY